MLDFDFLAIETTPAIAAELYSPLWSSASARRRKTERPLALRRGVPLVLRHLIYWEGRKGFFG